MLLNHGLAIQLFAEQLCVLCLQLVNILRVAIYGVLQLQNVLWGALLVVSVLLVDLLNLVLVAVH